MEEKLTYDNWNDQVQAKLNARLKDFMDVIKWAFQVYEDKILYSCSFGAEGIVLIDLIAKVNPCATIVFLDTGLHFPETYSLIEEVKQKYPNLNIKMVKPSLTVEEQAAEYGNKLWERHPNLCCHIRKIQPLARELSRVDAWISGLRREQSIGRRNIAYINKDDRFKSIKICPLIHWKWDDVWEYIKLNNLPYNKLHDNNYPSIGCEMCTLPVKDGRDARSGRWANFQKSECGLHQ
ncbi:phosphoadenylyl-sulfate reductase [Virgibacillus dakarensis]|uniref:Adenosine 5'-phosphosulfate reductase n=1 Tax=Lentibacillus populi TaxID=1827502 RepID=A0A9W5X4F0_9BACI|nr:MULTISPECIES: phosphoadenylyl-sulfate reductase [Bacillaceae]MBT2214954.1 phosphoadenylyl-sulfate reductase [Virgibacillus dakarensis]MTW84828.1 phosphoadenylyl-sulfate reductase [Virgibacillus dakarensis]GGB31500.1 putative phosphoadenosine phosphosulfate reductase [Lentibacillus populi]